jgi:hypothetical protein
MIFVSFFKIKFCSLNIFDETLLIEINLSEMVLAETGIDKMDTRSDNELKMVPDTRASVGLVSLKRSSAFEAMQ